MLDQETDDPSLSVGVRDGDDIPGQEVEVFHLEPEVADGILRVRIEPRADEDELGPDTVRKRFERRAEGRVVFLASRFVG